MSMECDLCGGEAFAVAPGAEEVRDLFVYARGQRARCWCEPCWLGEFDATTKTPAAQERPIDLGHIAAMYRP